MSHPFKSTLDEFQFAIKHFVPTLTEEIKAQAQRIHDQLLADETVDEAQIRKAFHDIGFSEYPYRKAYEELTTSSFESRMNDLVLEHVDALVKAVIEPHLKNGVHLEELVKSDLLIDSLTPEQRYQVIDGILVAKSKLAEALKAHVSDKSAEYDALVEKWKEHAQKIEKALMELEDLAKKADENQKAEILEKVQHFREGFLVIEEDPDLTEIEEEILYWKERFEEDQE